MTESCPCGSGAEFASCCGPLLAGETTGTTAEAVMRSRYSAFVKSNLEHLVRTVDLPLRKEMAEEDIDEWNKGVVWKGLTVLKTKAGGPGDASGIVEFVVRFEKDGEAKGIHEKARFKKRQGVWLYVDGTTKYLDESTPTAPVSSVKVGRNDPCPCGSGKKYKKCCG
ncbi:YchJ family protein [Desulfovibrio inopinatus]|uniref:YchJ family protein n=1 Tax=Desulfovibrio inopinatus TaxID=102109 RepID=UPI00040F3D86|nr:YchJ family metal-binding protein [Desulfovibrio inopinatus]